MDNRLARCYQQFVTNGWGDEVDQNVLRRVKVLNIAGSLLVTVAAAWTAVDYLAMGRVITTLIEASAAAAGVAFLIWQRKVKNINLTTNIALAIITTAVLLLTLYGGIGSSNYLWLYFLPPMAFFTTGVRNGFLWSGLALGWIIISSLLAKLGIYGSDVGLEYILDLTSSYLIVILLSFFYERTRASASDTLSSRNEQLQRLIYAISHDLRTPLSSLRGYVAFINEGANKGDYQQLKQDLFKVEQITLNMGQMIDDLLDLSRVGREVEEKQAVDIGQIVERVLDENESQLRAHRFNVQRYGEFPTLVCIPRKIEQVIRNLVSNAIKYSRDQDRPRIGLGVFEESDRYLFYVRDNGIGVDLPYHEKIFQLFYQHDKRGAGSGVGLAIVKGFVEDEGGHVWVESEKGKGSTFWFSLPKTVKPMLKPTLGVQTR